MSATAFAALAPENDLVAFYRVNLLTDAATDVGQFPLPITDIAVAFDTN